MKIVIRYILLLSILSAILSLKNMPTKQRKVAKVDPAIPSSKNITEVIKVENKKKELPSNSTQFKVNQTALKRTLNVTVPERKDNSTLLKQKTHKLSHKLLKNVTHTRKQENITEEKPKTDTPKQEEKPAEPVKPEEKNTTVTNTTKTEEEEEKNKHWWTKAWEWVFGKSKNTKDNKDTTQTNTTVTNSTTEEKPKEEAKKEETPKTEARKGNTLLKKRQ